MKPPFPDHLVMPGSQLLFTAMMAVLALAVAVVMVINSRKHKDWLPVWLLLGGALQAFIEPTVDVAGLIWYPPQGNWAFLHAGGISVPILVVFGSIWLYGGGGALIYLFLRKGANRGDVWKAFIAMMVFLMIIEFIGSGTGVYYYYGEQPLKIFGYVAYWGFINASTAIMVGVLAHLLRPHLTGWRMVFLPPIVPLAAGTTFFGAAIPVWVVLNSPPRPWVVTQLAGIATCLMCIAVVWIATRAVPAERNKPETLSPKGIAPTAQPQH